jgi:uncharacterized protein
MAMYKTPDVYVEEVSTLAPSVSSVSTAVPAFIGYTEKALGTGNENLLNTPVRINSMLDYQTLFGTGDSVKFQVNLTGKEISSIDIPDMKYLMYYALTLYFKNGGSPCYILSVGDYKAAPAKEEILSGIKVLEAEDEPTIIVMPDAVSLNEVDYYEVCQASLKHCSDLKDRFAIFDVLNDDKTAGSFRNGIIGDLKYGAAYYPYLQTSLNYYYEESDVSVTGFQDIVGELKTNGLKVQYNGDSSEKPGFEIKIDKSGADTAFEVAANKLILTVGSQNTLSQIIKAWNAHTAKGKFALESAGSASAKITAALAEEALAYDKKTSGETFKLSDNAVRIDQSDLYNKIKVELGKKRLILPPSSAIAGIYAKTDNNTGVWKAPANTALAGVIGPAVKVTARDQENLNIDPSGAGKSVNAIRSFTGKGTMVWGARTLDGSSNEWRYISVRRLFNYMEESIKKSTAFAVFEPNNALTWLKVKSMISTFLDDLWHQGALAGANAEQAYFVNVGLGTTMNEADITEGRLNIEIGAAAVRPAEFIILRFSHKLQENQ